MDVLIGHGRKIGGVVVDLKAGDEIGGLVLQFVVLQSQIGMDVATFERGSMESVQQFPGIIGSFFEHGSKRTAHSAWPPIGKRSTRAHAVSRIAGDEEIKVESEGGVRIVASRFKTGNPKVVVDATIREGDTVGAVPCILMREFHVTVQGGQKRRECRRRRNRKGNIHLIVPLKRPVSITTGFTVAKAKGAFGCQVTGIDDHLQILSPFYIGQFCMMIQFTVQNILEGVRPGIPAAKGGLQTGTLKSHQEND